MRRAWHEAGWRLRGQRRAAFTAGALRLAGSCSVLLMGLYLQQTLMADADFSAYTSKWDWMLPLFLLAAMTVAAPIRVQTAWLLGEAAGLLDEDDIGYLHRCHPLTLCGKALLLRCLCNLLLVLTLMPTLLLVVAAKTIWLLMPQTGEGFLYLLTILHLGIAAMMGFLLPLRVLTASTALPYSFLKIPHRSCLAILWMAFRLSHGNLLATLRLRLHTLPLILFPLTAPFFIPNLITAEMLRAASRYRHITPYRAHIPYRE